MLSLIECRNRYCRGLSTSCSVLQNGRKWLFNGFSIPITTPAKCSQGKVVNLRRTAPLVNLLRATSIIIILYVAVSPGDYLELIHCESEIPRGVYFTSGRERRWNLTKFRCTCSIICPATVTMWGWRRGGLPRWMALLFTVCSIIIIKFRQSPWQLRITKLGYPGTEQLRTKGAHRIQIRAQTITRSPNFAFDAMRNSYRYMEKLCRQSHICML